MTERPKPSGIINWAERPMKTPGSRQDGRIPSFRDYRALNHVAMVPDRGFRKQLKALDRRLEVVWDWGAEKWEIWCFPDDGQEPYHVTTVQTKNRTYRELGADILISLQQSMQLGPDQILRYIDEHNNQILRRKRQELIDKIQWAARDNWSTIFNVKGRPIAQLCGAEFLNKIPIFERKIPKIETSLVNKIVNAAKED